MTVVFGLVFAIALRLGVITTLLFFWSVNAIAADPLTSDEIIALDQLGFTEDEIRAELEPFQGTYEIGDAGLQALEAAGFSQDFLAFMESLRPQRQMDNAALAEMLADGATAVEVLRAMADAQTDFDASARAILDLRKSVELPLTVVTAMRGELEVVEPELRLLSADPQLREQFENWTSGRSRFNADLKQTGSQAQAQGWQKTYYRGLEPDGRRSAAKDHRTRIRLRPFAWSPQDGGKGDPIQSG